MYRVFLVILEVLVLSLLPAVGIADNETRSQTAQIETAQIDQSEQSGETAADEEDEDEEPDCD